MLLVQAREQVKSGFREPAENTGGPRREFLAGDVGLFGRSIY